MKKTMLTLALIGLVGCLAGESEVEPRAASAQLGAASAQQPLEAPAATTTTDQICRSLMRRQRGCTAQFIPALVEARVRIDSPPGLAARQREIGRDALIEAALEEWESDAAEPNIAALCDEIARSISPEKDALLRSSVSTCLAQPGCEEFVSCAVPLNLVHWKG